ncbi:hypothetical protein A2V82_17170 [candidate division KSB1 bacterium RBG_16_48_16]|nr:MAG: hypothetical protein A2V82_17170 [candidate division KSB1 bacterium RBG_16_48_16]
MGEANGIYAVIPARWASSRFPGKPLALIAGKPMIQWVYERTRRAKTLDQVIVGTDDERIYNAVLSFGGNAEMTPSSIPSGTDRVAFVMRDKQAEIVINVQGDEPLIDPASIELLIHILRNDASAPMATLARKSTQPQELENFDTARVVIDKNFYALYFSRSVIPYLRDVADRKAWVDHFPFYDHIGIYAYRKDFLMAFTQLAQSSLEMAEKLEQLRALENGYKIKVGICDVTPVCVDKPEHITLVERKMEEMGIHGE